ncbi:AAA family ATPase [Alphaproteobacteria bacterium HT1-32]|nr:AAA family ATPase [Alphaproteobacteria bacterium HT1-32]
MTPTVIVVGSEKGGTGKSTTSMHLVVAYLRSGKRVASIDLDARQGTLSRYLQNRAEVGEKRGLKLPMPRHLRLAPEDAGNDDERFAEALRQTYGSADVVVVDTPGADNELSRAAHSWADILITPINDSFLDLDVLANVQQADQIVLKPSHYSEAVFEAKKRRALRGQGVMDWIVMRNRLSSLDARNKRRIEALLTELSRRIGFRTIAGLGERVIYRELFPQGLTLSDLRDTGVEGSGFTMSHIAARQELRDLVRSIGV